MDTLFGQWCPPSTPCPGKTGSKNPSCRQIQGFNLFWLEIWWPIRDSSTWPRRKGWLAPIGGRQPGRPDPGIFKQQDRLLSNLHLVPAWHACQKPSVVSRRASWGCWLHVRQPSPIRRNRHAPRCSISQEQQNRVYCQYHDPSAHSWLLFRARKNPWNPHSKRITGPSCTWFRPRHY